MRKMPARAWNKAKATVIKQAAMGQDFRHIQPRLDLRARKLTARAVKACTLPSQHLPLFIVILTCVDVLVWETKTGHALYI
jgi:hypothetical protein